MSDLYYDVTGSGPVLLVLPGGAGHPMGLGPLTERLTAHFTVVMYDPLGLAHGHLEDTFADQRVPDWSEGAHRVLEAVLAEGESAYVFGTSAGGIAALDLLARHPGRLRHVIAHEPPCVTLLPDGERLRTELIGQLDGAQRDSAEVTPFSVFLAHVLRPFTAYRPPAGLPRLTVAAGADSCGQLLHRTAEFVARHTGGGFAEFPGGHLGTGEHPVAFADRIVETLLGAG
ncbi:alpha/beta fold hydrolase [Streptomyces fuscichromogenes]|uniref:Hydrolase n=1 Tax=Streptomyces fuscichromogenes TaxID=1324013 RepID=A0A917XJA0_9ACTN|nr:alpha/beta hydrolase [Streptomyces fuscichromogenes]GGN32584.1 hydrolase [Streptomyces fuscichromogenes]